MDDKTGSSKGTKKRAKMQKGGIKKSVSDQKNRSPSAGIKRFTRAEIVARDSKKVRSNALAEVKEKAAKPKTKKKATKKKA